MIVDILKNKPGGERIMNEYARTKSLTDSRIRDMVKILVAQMTSEHGYMSYTHYIPYHLTQFLAEVVIYTSILLFGSQTVKCVCVCLGQVLQGVLKRTTQRASLPCSHTWPILGASLVV